MSPHNETPENQPQPTLLIVDDNAENLGTMELGFTRSGYRTLCARGGKPALVTLEREEVDVVLTDLKMPDVDGLDVLRAAQVLQPPPLVILLTAYGTVESAVDALKMGAFDYLTKPVNLKELRHQVQRAMEHRALQKENIHLHREINRRYGFEGIIGEAPEMRVIFEKVRLIANSKATVLIQGESGTGKELLARAIHYNSRRARRPFMAVHCAAITETLLESELFGHEKGAFTGAVARKLGQFELAHGGALLLDEVGEIPAGIQAKLLRVLETKEFMRVGGLEPINVDVRFIAATNKNLEEEIAAGRFREDLFYRLNVIRFDLPPLRKRPDDIPLLVKHILEEVAEENQRPVPGLSKAAMARLLAFDWPGNVRQLRNCLENALVFCQKTTLDVEDLPLDLQNDPGGDAKVEIRVGNSLDAVERTFIEKTLSHEDGNRTRAARTLGISRRTLQRKLKELLIDPRKDGTEADREETDPTASK